MTESTDDDYDALIEKFSEFSLEDIKTFFQERFPIKTLDDNPHELAPKQESCQDCVSKNEPNWRCPTHRKICICGYKSGSRTCWKDHLTMHRPGTPDPKELATQKVGTIGNYATRRGGHYLYLEPNGEYWKNRLLDWLLNLQRSTQDNFLVLLVKNPRVCSDWVLKWVEKPDEEALEELSRKRQRTNPVPAPIDITPSQLNIDLPEAPLIISLSDSDSESDPKEKLEARPDPEESKIQRSKITVEPRTLYVFWYRTVDSQAITLHEYYGLPRWFQFFCMEVSRKNRIIIAGVETLQELVNVSHAMELEENSWILEWRLVGGYSYFHFGTEHQSIQSRLNIALQTMKDMNVEFFDPRDLDFQHFCDYFTWTIES